MPIKVTLTKSLIGQVPKNRKTVYALGLRKIGQSNTFEESESIRGMIHKVKHMIKVEEVEGVEVVRRRKGTGANAAKPKEAATKSTTAKNEASAKAKLKPKTSAKPKTAEEKAEAKPKRAPRKKKDES